MQRAYATWVGHSVVLHVAAAEMCVPVQGIVVGESDQAVRFRIGNAWDVDIFKSMIERIEENTWACTPTY